MTTQEEKDSLYNAYLILRERANFLASSGVLSSDQLKHIQELKTAYSVCLVEYSTNYPELKRGVK